MESATAKFLKNSSKLISLSESNDDTLTLHYKSHLQNYKGITTSQLHAQNEQYSWDKSQQVRGRNGEIECKFCFVRSIPKFKVQRIRQKGEKRVKKVAVYQCKKCKKTTMSKEALPQLDRSKTKEVCFSKFFFKSRFFCIDFFDFSLGRATKAEYFSGNPKEEKEKERSKCRIDFR